MWRIDIKSLVRNELFICRDYHIQPSEIRRKPYYEYEMMLDEIKEVQKEQEENEKKRQKEQDEMRSKYNPSSMMRNMKSSMPSMPKIQMPKI